MSSSDMKEAPASVEGGTHSTVASAPIPMGLLPHNSSVFVTNEDMAKSHNGGLSIQESSISDTCDTFSDGSGDAGSGYGSDGYGSGYGSDDTQPKSIYTNIVPVEKMINGWKNLSQWCMTGASSLKDKAIEGWQSTKEFRDNSWEYTKEGTRAGWAKTKEVTSASWKYSKNVSEKLKSAILPNRPSTASNLDSSPSSSDPSSPLSTSPLSTSPLTTQLNSPQSFSPPLSPRTSTDKEKGGMMIMDNNANINVTMNSSTYLNHSNNNNNHNNNNNNNTSNNNNKRRSAKDSPLLEEVDDYNV